LICQRREIPFGVGTRRYSSENSGTPVEVSQLGDARNMMLGRFPDVAFKSGAARCSTLYQRGRNGSKSARIGFESPRPRSAAPQHRLARLRTSGSLQRRAGVLAGIRRVRTPEGFRVVGKISSLWTPFACRWVCASIRKESGAENIDVIGTESGFTVEHLAGRSPAESRSIPIISFLKGSTTLRAPLSLRRGRISPNKAGFTMRETQLFRRRLRFSRTGRLGEFPDGPKPFFYQKNYQRQRTRSGKRADRSGSPSEKWTEVWSHIYLERFLTC